MYISLPLIHKIATLRAKSDRMNRIFHARITWYQYVALVLFTVNGGVALWCKFAIVGALLLLLVVVLIEQIIHTTYTLTPDGMLEIYQGRFVRRRVVPLREITSVEVCRSMRFGAFSVTRYVLIGYGKGLFVSVMPVKEREFVELIEKRRHEMAADESAAL